MLKSKATTKITRSEDARAKEIEQIRKEYYAQVEKHTPNNIKCAHIFDLNNLNSQKIRIKKEHIEKWNLEEWLITYKREAGVSTGGIRGAQNIMFPWDTRFPLNQLGVALATIGKAHVLKEDITGREINKLCTGEVRYNTHDYLEIIKRIHAEQGIRTHVLPGENITSVWMASFLIFMLDYDGGEYVTSSHAISSKIATKDLDNQGSQFTPELSSRFVKKIEGIIGIAEKNGFDITLGFADSPLITTEIDGVKMYIDYLKKGVATKENLDLIKKARDGGLEIMFECIGGCMYEIMDKITKKLGINSAYAWNNTEHDPFYHGIGKTLKNPITKKEEFFDYGCDTTIKETVETMGYEKLFADKPEGYPIIMVDPDGDRIVIGQIESVSNKNTLEKLGIPFIRLDNKRLMTYLTPNQSFLLTMDFHASQLKKAGLWENHPRFIITTTPSAASWAEWAEKVGVKVIFVPVGFKEIANIMKKIEKQILENKGKEVEIKDIFGNTVNLGIEPRLVFAGEESGGMITGPEELIKSRKGRIAIAMREKSAGEASIIVSAMIAKLYSDKKLFSRYLEEIFNKYDIKRRFDIRKEIRFYNESEPDPDKLKKSKAKGELLRDKTDDFFVSIALSLKEGRIEMKDAKKILKEALPELNFSNLKNIIFVGDGTYFDFTDKFIEIRKSGTDAIIKGYGAGENKGNCILYAEKIAGYNGKITPEFDRMIPKEIYKSCQQRRLDILKEFQRI